MEGAEEYEDISKLMTKTWLPADTSKVCVDLSVQVAGWSVYFEGA